MELQGWKTSGVVNVDSDPITMASEAPPDCNTGGGGNSGRGENVVEVPEPSGRWITTGDGGRSALSFRLSMGRTMGPVSISHASLNVFWFLMVSESKNTPPV